tara:strand:- start:2728 stop:2853 length:126 start_codon:yes stop_codon:yes gene_type:complete
MADDSFRQIAKKISLRFLAGSFYQFGTLQAEFEHAPLGLRD